MLSTLVAICVAGPLGLSAAVYLSEFASPRTREVVKPTLELLSGVPTVVYGFFALLFVTPLLQTFIPGLPGFNILSAGIVMGIMIIPYVASLSEMRCGPCQRPAGRIARARRDAARDRLPGRPAVRHLGVAAAFVLGISRAVGETMVVAIAAGQQPNLTLDPTEPARRSPPISCRWRSATFRTGASATKPSSPPG